MMRLFETAAVAVLAVERFGGEWLRCGALATALGEWLRCILLAMTVLEAALLRFEWLQLCYSVSCNSFAKTRLHRPP